MTGLLARLRADPFVVDAKTIIAAKRDGKELSEDQLRSFIDGAVSGNWSPAQVGALLMAAYLRGLSQQETVSLTHVMRQSGETMDFGPGAPLVDKHSTGGVGDKVSIVLAPLAAACGLRVPMLSGRGLGHTGGTLDKLESIPGFRTQLNKAEIESIVARTGCVMAGQSATIVPADRLLYATRDETSTVESQQLISASILSKKLAEGLDGLVLDVKFGRGAFMPTLEKAEELANRMVGIGRAAGCRVGAWLTRMDCPLGASVGNAVEVAECIEMLRGGGSPTLRGLILDLVAGMVHLGWPSEYSMERGRELAQERLQSGAALEVFRSVVAAHGGDPAVLDDPGLLPAAPVQRQVVVPGERTVTIADIDARKIAELVLALDAGRRKAADSIDPATGISGLPELGAQLEPGQPLATIHCRSEAEFTSSSRQLLEAVRFAYASVEPEFLLSKIIL
jgi:pyrimidine-nucleoside phosphorylase